VAQLSLQCLAAVNQGRLKPELMMGFQRYVVER
jgi:hypothetical protein